MDGPHTAKCRADCDARHAGLGEGRVEAAFRAVFSVEAFGRAKHAAGIVDTLAHHEDARVEIEGLVECLVDRLGVAE